MGGALQGYVCCGLRLLQRQCVRARLLPFLALHDATQNADPVAHPSSMGLLCVGADSAEPEFCKFKFAILQFQFFAGRVETEIPLDDGFCNLDTSWRQFQSFGLTALKSRLMPVKALCFLRRKIPLPFATGGRILKLIVLVEGGSRGLESG